MSLIRASIAAAELRKLAEHLEKIDSGEALIDQPSVYFSYYNPRQKDSFVSLIQHLPRPLKKEFDDHDARFRYKSEGLYISVSIPRSAVCRLVTPAQAAVYECEPVLGEGELAEIEAEESHKEDSNV